MCFNQYNQGVIALAEEKEKLVRLILDEDISSILLLSEKLGLDGDAIRNLLEQLVQEGALNGYLTEDGKRFFRRDVEVSHKPIIHREDPPSRIIERDNKSLKWVAIFGGFLMANGFGMMLTSQGDLSIENFAVALMLVGAIFAMCGCYLIASQQTI